MRLQRDGNCVRVGRVRREGKIDTGDGGVGAQTLQDFQRDVATARFQHGVERFQPLLNLDVVQALQRCEGFVIHVLELAPKNARTRECGAL